MQPLPTAEGAEAHTGNHARSSWHYQFFQSLALNSLSTYWGENNLYKPNTQLQVKLKALTD